MFPPIFPISIAALAPLHNYGTLIWFVGVVCLWATRYTHQLGQRWGRFYYGVSAVLRPVGILFIGVGWMALYAPEYPFGSFLIGWLPRGEFVDVLSWVAMMGFFALGVWSVLTIGIRESFLYRRVEDELETKGPYRLVRHPQFLSAIGIIFFGIRLFNPSSFSFTVYGSLDANWALFTLALWLLSIEEERELRAHFGKTYEEYVRRVPRLFPN